MSDDAVKIPPAVSGVGGWLDDRFHGAKGVRVLMRKVFPDHWSFMLGEIALWSFVILLLTGTYLALFFEPVGRARWSTTARTPSSTASRCRRPTSRR